MTTTPCGRDHQWKKKWFRVESLIFNLTDGFVFFGRSLIIVALKKFIQFVLKVKRKIPFRFGDKSVGHKQSGTRMMVR